MAPTQYGSPCFGDIDSRAEISHSGSVSAIDKYTTPCEIRGRAILWSGDCVRVYDDVGGRAGGRVGGHKFCREDYLIIS